MQPVPSPFLPQPDATSIGVAINPADADSRDPFLDAGLEAFDTTELRQQLSRLRDSFPERSDFAVIDLDCCLLLALQLSRSDLQGFDLVVLLFLLAHFDHKRPTIKLSLSEIARQLDRQPSQVRRSMRKLERLGWARFDRRGLIQISPVMLRSANSRYRAMHFRHASTPFRRSS